MHLAGAIPAWPLGLEQGPNRFDRRSAHEATASWLCVKIPNREWWGKNVHKGINYIFSCVEVPGR